jgi:Dolichyl-phosphate-mannose-protein mannosyltransferase
VGYTQVNGDDPRPLDLLWIALAWLAAALLVRPFQNTPFIDDWVYAWPVERLLQGGDLRLLDYSGSLNPVQVFWGVLFCLPFGFSFTALRVATWVVGLLGLWGMYLLLRDQKVIRRDALAGTACLGAYPIYFALSFSFMTDIPLVTCIIWGTLAFLRARSRRSNGWLWIGIAVSCAAVGTRVAGVVLPVAMGLTLLVDPEGWGRRNARFVWPMTALVFFGLIAWWFQRHLEDVGDLTDVFIAPGNRMRLLKEQAFQFLPVMSVCAAKFLAGALGLALLPLAAGVISRRQLWNALAVMVGLLAIVTTSLCPPPSHPTPLTTGQTWSPGELGMTESLVLDYDKPEEAAWWVWVVTAVTIGSASVVVARSVRRPAVPDTFLLLQIVGQFLLIGLLWLFFDRYALALVPVAMVLALRGGPIVRPRVTAALIVAMGLVALVGVRDHLAYNRALWMAVEHLQSIGIAAADFDGGYVVNGWLQWAHPEHARRDAAGAVAVPEVNVSATVPYRISNQAKPGWKVVASFPYTRWVGRSERVYVLEQRRGAGA